MSEDEEKLVGNIISIDYGSCAHYGIHALLNYFVSQLFSRYFEFRGLLSFILLIYRLQAFSRVRTTRRRVVPVVRAPLTRLRVPTASKCGSRSVAGRTSSSPMTSSRTGAISGRLRYVSACFSLLILYRYFML